MLLPQHRPRQHRFHLPHRYDEPAMAQREQISISGGTGLGGMSESQGERGKTPLRMSILRPDFSPGTRRGLVIINRGVASGETDLDFLDAIANGLVEAGLIVALPESRTTQLIMDDFHRFTFADEVGDLTAIVRHGPGIADVDPSRINVLGWSLGAIAALDVAGTVDTVNRCCLLNPATPASVAACVVSATTRKDARGAEQEAAPQAFVDGLAKVELSALAAAARASMLLVHAAADRFMTPDASNEIAAAFALAKRPAERVLIARADHTFRATDTRAACIERLVGYFTSAVAAKTTRSMSGMAIGAMS